MKIGLSLYLWRLSVRQALLRLGYRRARSARYYPVYSKIVQTGSGCHWRLCPPVRDGGHGQASCPWHPRAHAGNAPLIPAYLLSLFIHVQTAVGWTRYDNYFPGIFSLTTLAGIPTTSTWSGTSVVTTAPAPITECDPMVMWSITIAPIPM